MADVLTLFGRVVECVMKAQDIRAMAASSRRHAADAEAARIEAEPITAAVFQTLEDQFLESAASLEGSAAAWDELATRYNERLMRRVRSILRVRTGTSRIARPCGFRK